MDDFSDRLVLYYSKRKHILPAIVSIITAVVVIWGTFQEIERGEVGFAICGGLNSLFFGIAFFVIVRRFFANTENVLIDKYGIHVINWQCGPIPWNHITEIWTETIYSKGYSMKAVTFHVTKPSIYIDKIPLITQFATGVTNLVNNRRNEFSLLIDGYQKSEDEIWQHIQKLITVYEIPVTVRTKH